MKKWLILIGIIAIVLISAYFALSFYAVKFIRARLHKMERLGLTITSIETKPSHLRIRGIRYEEPISKQRIFHIEEIRIYPGLLSPLKGAVHIRVCTVLKPTFFLYRSYEGVFTGAWAPIEKEERGQEFFNDRVRRAKERVSIKIDRFCIRKGSIDFEDRKMGENPAKVELRELDLEIKDIQYPMVPAPSSIALKGKLKGRTEEQNIEIKGWVDPETMDMETSFKAREIEVKIFEPYYRKRVSAQIESGYMNMETTIAVKKKMIDAPGQLELIDLRLQGEGTVFWIPSKTLITLLKKRGDRLKIQFHIKGNLDDPKFNLQETILTKIAISFLEAFGIPIKWVGEEFLEGMGKEGEGWAEGLKSLKEMFKKNKEKKK